MYPFRDKTPIRRTDVNKYKDYSSHKITLQEDFNNRCGYCDDFDGYRIRYFTIDHFVPQKPKDLTHDIEPSYYPNLVYACSFCNLAKSNKWFTGNIFEHNDGKVGFIDPTTDEYTELFKRDKEGQINCNGKNHNLSNHIIFELKLDFPIHSKNWKFERLNILLSEIEKKIDNTEDEQLKETYKIYYYDIFRDFRQLVENLFAENE